MRRYCNFMLIILQWKNKKIIVIGTGHNAKEESGKMSILCNLETGKPAQRILLDMQGEISGSAAPIPGPNGEIVGFIVGADAANKIACFMFEDLFTINGKNDLIGKPNLTYRWVRHTDSGISTSISVEYDKKTNRYAYYFSDKHGSFYKMYSNGEFAWIQHRPENESKFIFKSPALDDKYVYYPIRYYGDNDNPGGLEVRNKADGTLVKKILLDGQAMTAPLVWTQANAVLIGDNKGYLYAFDRTTWQPKPFAYDTSILPATKRLEDLSIPELRNLVKPKIKVTFRPPSNPTTRSVPNGITTDLSMSNGYLVFGVDDHEGHGYLVGYKAVTSDIGVSSVQVNKTVQPGSKNTVKVTLHNESLKAQTVVVGVYDWRYKHYMDLGNTAEAEKYIVKQKIDLSPYPYGNTGKPGQRIVNFTWTAPELGEGKTEQDCWVTASILQMDQQYNQDKTDDEGAGLTTITYGTTDIAVTSIKQNTPAEAGTPQLAEVTFENKGTKVETFTVHFYIDGARSITRTMSMAPGAVMTKGFNWVVPTGKTQVTIKVEADPFKQLPDVNRNNNSLSKPIAVTDNKHPLYCEDKKTCIQSSTWTEGYWIITSYNEDGSANWDKVNVNFSESLAATVKMDTKQDIETDPKHPKESDRESRGSWEIIPWAEEQGLIASKVTRAGYGFELEVETTYSTDFEDPDRVPKGKGGTAVPIGGVLWGPRSVSVEFWDTNNRSVGIVNLVPISGDPTIGISNGKKVVKWGLPEVQTTLADGTKVYERKHYTSVNIPDGKYYVTIYMDGIGKNNLCLCKEDYVTIFGDMYDDIYTGGNR